MTGREPLPTRDAAQELLHRQFSSDDPDPVDYLGIPAFVPEVTDEDVADAEKELLSAQTPPTHPGEENLIDRITREESDAVLWGWSNWDDAPRRGLNNSEPIVPAITRTVRLKEPVDLWWRNGHRDHEASQKIGWSKFIWPARMVRESRLGGSLYATLERLSPGLEWQCWVVNRAWAEYYNRSKSGSTMKVVRRAPVWRYDTGDPEVLLAMCQSYKRHGWDRIFITGLPHSDRTARKIDGPLGTGKRVRAIQYIHKIGALFPHVRLHMYGQEAFRLMFGLNCTGSDIDPAVYYYRQVIMLPNGMVSTRNQLKKWYKWLHVIGFSATNVDLANRANSVLMTMHSAMWAAENYNSLNALNSTRPPPRPDPAGLFPVIPDRSNRNHRLHSRLPAEGKIMAPLRKPVFDADGHPQMSPVSAVTGKADPYSFTKPISHLPIVEIKPRGHDAPYDKILCDPCTKKKTCRYVREGGLCIVPGSPSAGLARLFATRDAEQIRVALSAVLQHQAERLTRLSGSWDGDEPADLETDELIKRSEHQMKLENSLARGAEAMIKILDPTQRIPSTIPAVNATQINVYNPATLVADVVKRLESAGVSRDNIDPSMIIDVAREKGMLEGPK